MLVVSSVFFSVAAGFLDFGLRRKEGSDYMANEKSLEENLGSDISVFWIRRLLLFHQWEISCKTMYILTEFQ